MIHPTAIVHPKAQIAEDCEIGPYCIIGEHVQMGPGCKLHSHVVVDGHTRMGKNNEVFPFSTIGLRTQDLKFKGGVARTEIGDHNTVRECVTIHSATGDGEATVIGNYNNILASSHIGHNIVIGNRVIISMAGLAGHVLVEDYAIIGGMTGIHQFCRIGKMSIVGGCSGIRQDVAPFMLVEGDPGKTRTINKVGMERNGVSAEAQSALKQAHKILFREGLTTPNALARIEQEVPPLPEVQYLVQFVRTSERGITK